MKRIVTKGLGPLRHNPASHLRGTGTVVADEEALFDEDARPPVPGSLARSGRDIDSATPDTLVFEADVEHGVPGLTRHPDGLTTTGQSAIEVPVRDGRGSAKRAPDVGVGWNAFVTLSRPGTPGAVTVLLRVAERRRERPKRGAEAPTVGCARASVEAHLNTVHRRSLNGRPRPVKADVGQDEPIRRAVTRRVRPLKGTRRLRDSTATVAATIRSPKDRKFRHRDVAHHVRPSATRPHLRKSFVRRKPDFATSRTRGAELTDEIRLGVFGQVHASDGFPAFPTRFGERGGVRGSAPPAPQDGFFGGWQRHCLRLYHRRRDPHGEKRADKDDESLHRTLLRFAPPVGG
jgi:hypothetical protein